MPNAAPTPETLAENILGEALRNSIDTPIIINIDASIEMFAKAARKQLSDLISQFFRDAVDYIERSQDVSCMLEKSQELINNTRLLDIGEERHMCIGFTPRGLHEIDDVIIQIANTIMYADIAQLPYRKLYLIDMKRIDDDSYPGKSVTIKCREISPRLHIETNAYKRIVGLSGK